MTTIPNYLLSDCDAEVCYNFRCAEAVKASNETGRYFITMNHPGFNSPANNRDGYASMDSARSAVRRYGRLGR